MKKIAFFSYYRSYWSGLTCSHLVSNVPENQGGLLVICHCVFNEQDRLRKGPTWESGWSQWDGARLCLSVLGPAQITGMGAESPGTRIAPSWQ